MHYDNSSQENIIKKKRSVNFFYFYTGRKRKDQGYSKRKKFEGNITFKGV